jgi:hypothetical protein
VQQSSSVPAPRFIYNLKKKKKKKKKKSCSNHSASVDFRVWLDDEFALDLGCAIPPQCRKISIRPAPSVLYVLLDQQLVTEQVSSSPFEIHNVDLSGVPRDILPLLRPLLGQRRDAVLMRSSQAPAGQFINMSMPFVRQGIVAQSSLTIVSVNALFKRVLGSFVSPLWSGWLQKRSNVLTHRRFCIISERCLIYFKSDGKIDSFFYVFFLLTCASKLQQLL